MQFLAHYWWLLVLPFAIFFWIQSMRQVRASQWVWILRITGIALLIGPTVWLVTGDVENRYVSIHMGSSWSAAVAIILGLAALAGAQRLVARRPPV